VRMLELIGLRRTANRLQSVDPNRLNRRPEEVRIVPTESIDDRALDVMIAEASDLTKAMREFLMTADRFVYFAGIIAVGTFILGVLRPDTGKNWLLFTLAPYPLGIIFGYLMQIYTEVERRAGLKQFLEEEINRRLGSRTLVESEVNSSRDRTRLSGTLMKLLQGAVLIVFVALSVKQTWRFAGRGPALWNHHLLNWNSLNIFLLLFVVAVLLQSLRENRVASRQAYRTARQIAQTSHTDNQDARSGRQH